MRNFKICAVLAPKISTVDPASCRLSGARPARCWAGETPALPNSAGSNEIWSSNSIAAGASLGSSSSAVSSSRSVYVPASIACPSSITALNDLNAASARCGKSCLRVASPSAPHSEAPVSSATRSRVSSVALPIPRAGVLITRNSEIESSGLCMTFRYEIMSLISARS